MKVRYNSLADHLNHLLSECKGRSVSLKIITEALSGKGLAPLLIVLVLPFCLPLQIPALSTPFGIVLMFIGLRIAFRHNTWIPKFLLSKEISYTALKKIATLSIRMTDKFSFLISTRWVGFVNHPILRMIHGLSIAFMAFILALPLPIPFTNLLMAYPILFFGLALLEDDGLMLFVAYLLFLSCLCVLITLIFFNNDLF